MPQREALGDGRLADARFADEHRVVLRAAGEDLHDAADLLVAADHRVELPLLGTGHQVDAVLLQGLELAFRVLVGHPGRAADALQGLKDRLLVDRVELERLLSGRLLFGEGQQQVLGGDELVAHRLGRLLGGLKHAAQVSGKLRRVPGGRLHQPLQFRINDLRKLIAVGPDLLQEGPDHTVRLVQKRREQVQRIDLRIPRPGRKFMRPLHGLLGLDRQFVESEWHGGGLVSGEVVVGSG